MTRDVAEGWEAILLRRPTWRAEAEIRAEYERDGRPEALVASLGPSEPGRVAIDLAEVDARPSDAASTDGLPCPGDARRVECLGGGGAGLDPGVLADRAPLSAPPLTVGAGQRTGLAAGTPDAFGLVATGFDHGGRTSRGSIRAISAAGSFIRFATAGSSVNVATSNGLNRP